MEDNTMTNDLYELGEMRRQITLLKEKLDNESIINDKLMRSVMKTKVGKVDSYLLKMLFITPLVMALMAYGITDVRFFRSRWFKLNVRS